MIPFLKFQSAEKELIQLKRALECLLLPIALVNPDGKIILANQTLGDLSCYSSKELEKMNWDELVMADNRDQAAFKLIASGQRTLCRLNTTIKTQQAKEIPGILEITAGKYKSPFPDWLMILFQPAYTNSISTTKNTQLLQKALEKHVTATLILSQDQRIVFSNQEFSRQSGFSRSDLVNNSIEIIHPEEGNIAPSFKKVAEPAGWQENRQTSHRDGSQYWVHETVLPLQDVGGNTTHFMLCHTPAQSSKPRKADPVTRDQLTGLGNRSGIEQYLDQLIEKKSLTANVAVGIIDIDQFRIINEICNREGGDALLCQVAKKIETFCSEKGFAARLSGDEFAIAKSDMTEDELVEQLDSLRQELEKKRFNWCGEYFPISVSIGISTTNDSNKSSRVLLSQADKACYAAKNSGRNRLHVYHENDADCLRQSGEIFWILSINRAIERNHFKLFAQEIAPLAQPELGQRRHFEILIRYYDDNGDIHLPGEFMAIAEQNLLSPQIDRWTIKNTIAWLQHLSNQDSPLPICSINLSGHSIKQLNFLDFLIAEIQSSELPTDVFCFELTETATVGNLTTARSFIEALHELGCSVSLDDFGSGLSSFAYLKHLPIDYLKIDGMFVKNICFDPIDLTMVRSITDIGHVMGKKVVAEWVENEITAQILKELEVDYIQGFWIGRPEPVEIVNTSFSEVKIGTLSSGTDQ